MSTSRRKIGLEFRSVNNLIKRYLDNNTHRKDVEQITGTNGWIIGYLDRNRDRDIFLRDLEAEFSITRSTASKVVNLMVKKGLIERQSVPRDARLKKLVLTPKAMELTEIMADNGRRLDETLLKGFSPEEVEMLYVYLDRIKKNIE